MLHFPRWKIVTIVLICLWAFWSTLPNFLPSSVRASLGSMLPSHNVSLGLDLQGGSYLLLHVDIDTYVAEQLQSLVDDIRVKLREKQIGYKELGYQKTAVMFSLRDISSEAEVREILSEYRQTMELDVANDGRISLTYLPEYLEEVRRYVVDQSIEIVRRRVDETGTREPIIQRQGDERILLQVPGLQDPERLKQLLGQTAKMTFHLMDEETPFPTRRVTPKPGTQLLEGDKEGQRSFYLVKRKIELSGDLLVHAQASFDQARAVVTFRFNNEGGRKFARITKQNVNKPFAIVLDGSVISAPVINEPILGGSGVISGNFTVQSANDLALLLRAGALPAPLTVLEERTVGPSLGADSIEAGKRASLLAILLVLVSMSVLYGRFGWFSTVALMCNIILIIAVLSLLQATLTLPGIAGIVLTMGMAVDANILIFERIREEVRAGKTPFAAIDHGFQQAFRTITDSNITTLIATLLLFIYGSGPVKGFAVTLSVGILTSMFSAILLTRMMVVLWLKRHKPKTLEI